MTEQSEVAATGDGDMLGREYPPHPILDTVWSSSGGPFRIGHEVDLIEFIQHVGSRLDPGDGRITAWTWKSIGPPTRTDKRDIEGHKAYESAVAGRNVVHVFTSALSFLRHAQSLAQSAQAATQPHPG